LSPIEHLWSCLGKLVDKKRATVKNVDELEAALEVASGETYDDLAERLVGSMKDRCQPVIDANGSPMKY
jgi:hypothetical protein